MKKKGTYKIPIGDIACIYKTAFLLLLSILFMLPVTGYASHENFQSQPQETYSVRGKVTDPGGIPLPGVTIRLSGTTLGCASDHEGNFVLRLPVAKGELECSFVGYKTIKVPFFADKPLTIKMSENMERLDEVVVIGYGT